MSAAEARAEAAGLLGLVGIRTPARAPGRLPAPALRRHAPAGDDRHGARLPPGPADRRRADDRARRDHPGADPRADARPAGGVGMSVLLITHDLGVVAEICRRRGGHVRRARSSRAAAVADALRRPAAPLHARPASSSRPRAWRPQERGCRPIPGMVAEPVRPAAGLPLRDRCCRCATDALRARSPRLARDRRPASMAAAGSRCEERSA